MDQIQPKKSNLPDLLVPLGLVGAYFAAQLWILPAMGVGT